MKPTAIIASIALLAVALTDSFMPRPAHAAPAIIPEQYLIVSVARGQTDDQVVAQLNALGAEGWRLRCSIPNGVIMAR
jgi:hypothetical protein